MYDVSVGVGGCRCMMCLSEWTGVGVYVEGTELEVHIFPALWSGDTATIMIYAYSCLFCGSRY